VLLKSASTQGGMEIEGTTSIIYVGGSLVKKVEAIALKYGAKIKRILDWRVRRKDVKLS